MSEIIICPRAPEIVTRFAIARRRRSTTKRATTKRSAYSTMEHIPAMRARSENTQRENDAVINKAGEFLNTFTHRRHEDSAQKRDAAAETIAFV